MQKRIMEYYNELQRRENIEPVELIADWAEADTDAISTAFRNAFNASRIAEQTIPVREGSSNQSLATKLPIFLFP